MWFTSVGKQALKFCALELIRLIFWVTDCAGELWAFPEGKRWNISIMLKTYGKTTAQHAILENWPSPKKKESGGARKTLSSFPVRFSHFCFTGRGWERSEGMCRVWGTWPSTQTMEFSFLNFTCMNRTMALQVTCCYHYCHYRWRNWDFERLSNTSKVQGTESDTFEN